LARSYDRKREEGKHGYTFIAPKRDDYGWKSQITRVDSVGDELVSGSVTTGRKETTDIRAPPVSDRKRGKARAAGRARLLGLTAGLDCWAAHAGRREMEQASLNGPRPPAEGKLFSSFFFFCFFSFLIFQKYLK
jgi:hypothetical protein